MRKLAVILILCLIPAMVGGDAGFIGEVGGAVSAPAGCTSGTTDVEYDYTSGAYSLPVDAAAGREFTPSQTGQVYSISVYCSYAASSPSVTIRWGTSADLSTYEAEETFTILSGQWNEVVFTTKGNVTASTTYYFGLMETSGDARIAYLSSGGPGRLYSASGWNMGSTQPDWNLAYRVALCN